MRLIDADEAIINFGFEWDDVLPTREEFVLFLKKQSIIDAVPVVRCGKCKHFRPYEGEEHKGDCAELVGLESCVYEDDFCSYGERKEGADNV